MKASKNFVTRSQFTPLWDKQIGECTSFASSEIAWTSFDKSTKTFYKHPSKNGKEKKHPTQKPIQLMTWVLSKYCDKDAVVYDPFMGSGTTGVACVELGREFIGSEISPEYFAIAEKRIEQASRQGQLFTTQPANKGLQRDQNRAEQISLC